MALVEWKNIIGDAQNLTNVINSLKTESKSLFDQWSKGSQTIAELQAGLEKVAVTNSRLKKVEDEYNDLQKKSIQLQKEAAKEADRLSKSLDKELQLSNELIASKQRQVKEEAKLQAAKKQIIELQKKESLSDKELIQLNQKLAMVRANLTRNTKENRIEYAKLTAEIQRNEKVIRQNDASIGRFQRNVGNYAGAFKSFGASLGIMGGAFILANGIKNSINKIKDFEKAISNLKAITGAAGKDLEYLKNQSLKLAAETGNSAIDIVEAFKLVASAKPELLSNVTALNDMTKAVITLSQASGMDLQTSTGALTSIMNQFGASADEANRYINVLGAGAKFGSGEIDYLSDAIVKSGTVFAATGGQIETLTAAMELFAEKGVKAEIAGTGFKSILVRMQSDVKNYTNGQFDLNKAMDNYKGIATNNVELAKTFGKEYFSLAGILLQNTDRFKELEKQVTGTNTALEQAAINMDNLSGDLDKAAGAWDAFVLSIQSDDGAITKVLRGIVSAITDILNGLIEINKFGKIISSQSQTEAEKNIESFKEQIKYSDESIKRRRIHLYLMKLEGDLINANKELEEKRQLRYTNEDRKKEYFQLKDKYDQLEREKSLLIELGSNVGFLTTKEEIKIEKDKEENKGEEEKNKTYKKGNDLLKERILTLKELSGPKKEDVQFAIKPEAVLGSEDKIIENEIAVRYSKLQKYIDQLTKGEGSLLSRLFGGGKNGEQAAQALTEVWGQFSQVYNEFLQKQIEKYDQLVDKSEERIDSIKDELNAELDRIAEVQASGQAYDKSRKEALENQLKAEQEYLTKNLAEQKKAKQKAQRMAQVEAGINLASAIMKIWAGGGNYWIKLAQSIAMAALGAVQISNISSAKYATGTEFLERGGNPSGTDTIPILADEGERILSKKQNKLIPRWFKNDLIPEAVNYFINGNGQVIVKEDKQALKHLAGIEANTSRDIIRDASGKVIQESKGNHVINYN